MNYTKFEGILIKNEDFEKVPIEVLEQAEFVMVDMEGGRMEVYKNRFGNTGNVDKFNQMKFFR